MTIAVVVKGYPRLSETFVAQELLGLERRGFALRIVSLRHPTDPARHPIHDEIAAPVEYLPEYLHDEPRRVAGAWRKAKRLPGYAAARRAFLADLRRDPTRNRIRRFGQACVLAAECDPTVTHLHAHFLHTPASVARYAGAMRRLPFSLSAHAKDVWTTPDWDLAGKLREAAWAVACSDAAAARLREIAPGADIETLYHGLDLARFTAPKSIDGTAPDGRDSSAPVQILTVSRAVEKKGLDVLLDALHRLPEALHWRLTHIGAGPLLPALRERTVALGLDDRVTWRGAQPQTAVIAALRGAHLFVLPSRIARGGDRDGLPNVLMEAHSQGLVTVATRVSAIPELIADGETGVLVPPDDVDALASAIENLFANPARRRALGDRAQRRLRARFDSEDGLDRLAARFAPRPTLGPRRRPGKDARAA